MAHSGFVSAQPLRDLYPDVPVVNHFEYFYHPHNSDLDFRPDTPATGDDRNRARFRNAAILLDLEGCAAGYSPTAWQRDRFPAVYRDKLQVIFDGVDTNVWYPRGRTPRHFAIDPTGRWLVAANQQSGTLAVFSIDQNTGRLSPVGPLTTVGSPVSVRFM